MKIEKFKITDTKRQETRPHIRLSGIGCGLDGCDCSPKFFLSISDGKTGLSVTLTAREYEYLISHPDFAQINGERVEAMSGEPEKTEKIWTSAMRKRYWRLRQSGMTPEEAVSETEHPVFSKTAKGFDEK